MKRQKDENMKKRKDEKMKRIANNKQPLTILPIPNCLQIH